MTYVWHAYPIKPRNLIFVGSASEIIRSYIEADHLPIHVIVKCIESLHLFGTHTNKVVNSCLGGWDHLPIHVTVNFIEKLHMFNTLTK